MRTGGSPTTLGVLLYAIGAATAHPTGLFSDASAKQADASLKRPVGCWAVAPMA